MPLDRFILKNEYGLGRPELYRDANRDDPASILDGVAASALVGLLRQLANLAEFSIEVFRSIEEQVDVTTSRSHDMTMRVRQLEDALPSLEKAVLAQTSHIHFAYTTGCDWHPHIECKLNNLKRSNLPPFILDNYEGCRRTPNLHLLDRFDVNGSGSCLKRYSDPTLFRGLSSHYDRAYVCNSRIYNKTRRTKRRRPSSRIKDALVDASFPKHDGRAHKASSPDVQSSVYQVTSTSDRTIKCDPKKSIFDTGVDLEYTGCIFSSSSPLPEMEPTENEYSKPDVLNRNIHDINLGQKQHYIVDFVPTQSSLDIKDVCNWLDVTQVEKAEIKHHEDEPPLLSMVNSENVHKTAENSDQEYAIYENSKHEMTVSNIILCDNKTTKAGIVFSDILCGNEQSEPEIIEPRICFDTLTNETHISEVDVPSGNEQIEAENVKFGIIEHNENIMTVIPEPNGEVKHIFDTDEKFDPVKSEPFVYFKFETFFPEVVGSYIPFNIEESKPEKVEGYVNFNCDEIKPETVFQQHFINGGENLFLENLKKDSAVHIEDDVPEVEDPIDLAATFCDSGEYTSNNNYNSEEAGKGNIVDQRKEFVNISAIYNSECVKNTDEIESESGSYLDALNTIESESDNDTVSEPKRELEEISCSDSIGSVPDAAADLLLCHSIDILSDFGYFDKSLCFAESETCFDSKEILSEHEDITTTMKFNERCSSPEAGMDEDTTSDLGDSVIEPFNDDSVSSSSMASAPHIMTPENQVSSTVSTPYISTLEKDVISFGHLQDGNAVECLTAKSTILWTNGSLLGLQPSKPTDYVLVKTEQNKDMGIGKDGVIFDEEPIVFRDKNEMNERMGVLKGGSQNNVNYENIEPHKVCYSDQDNYVSSGQAHYRYQMDETIPQDDTMAVGCMLRGKQTSDSDVRATTSESKSNHGGSTEFLETISGNGVQRKTLPIISCVSDDLVFSHCNLINRCADSEDQTCDFVVFPPSPPLEPIKIELCPADIFDTPELKLRFLDRSEDRECIGDVLHSFELVCEPGFPLHGVSYDSDDKTFNESSRYAQYNDCLSSDSDSIVEQFDPKTFNIGKFDENSTGDSVSEYLMIERATNAGCVVDNKIEHCFIENAVELCFSQFTEIPNSERTDTLVDAKIAEIFDKRCPVTSKHAEESTRLSSASQETTEKNCLDSRDDGADVNTDPGVKSTFSNQQQHSHLGKKNISEPVMDAPLNKERHDTNLKWDEDDETHPSLPNKSIKPENDFLHQIRSKSLNLRHREFPRPILTRNISIGVATILEKARAIRKDVASDEEDADSWSDS